MRTVKAIFRKTVGKARFLGPAVIVVVALVLISNVAYAYTTSHLQPVQLPPTYTEQIYNYDFYDPILSSTGVACPVTMVFYQNAWVNKVKNIYWGTGIVADLDYARLNDGGGWIWDGDKGTKTVYYCSKLGYYVHVHLRVYAPNPPDYMYDPYFWGRYVIGTTHYDEFPEPPEWSWHGYHEYAEEEYYAKVARNRGYSVYEDCLYLQNYEPYRIDEDEENELICYWLNSGMGTIIPVP